MSVPEYQEPSADLRQAALAMRAMFNALTEAGFKEQQALYLCAQMARPEPQPGDQQQ